MHQMDLFINHMNLIHSLIMPELKSQCLVYLYYYEIYGHGSFGLMKLPMKISNNVE